jgi:hypothetical protein
MCSSLRMGVAGRRGWPLSERSCSLLSCPALISRLLPKWLARAGLFYVQENEWSDAGKPSQQTQGGSHSDPP